MDGINLSLGIIELPVNGSRTIKFNPTDINFIEILYSMLAKVESIERDKNKKLTKTEESKQFDVHRLASKRMEDAVDSVFGDGFCKDVFCGISLLAVNEDTGLFLLEELVLLIVDRMDQSVMSAAKKRNATIAKYTAKYKEHKNDLRPPDKP